MIAIICSETEHNRSTGLIEASPEMFKDFWPDVRGSYFFRSRRLYLDFMRSNGGRIYFIPDGPRFNPPFVLVGNWRSREDITALWYVKAEGELKKNLVIGAASLSFEAGSEKLVTKPLKEREAGQYRQWGFEQAHKIVLLEREQRQREMTVANEKEGVDIIRFKKKFLDDVLRLDATAFDDFWRLDVHAIATIATSCFRNVFLVARKGDEILGYVAGGANGTLGYLQRVGVHAKRQGEGIGEALVRRLLQDLQSIGAMTVMVNTQEDNEAALSLYRKLGFAETPESRFIMYYTPEIMERNI